LQTEQIKSARRKLALLMELSTGAKWKILKSSGRLKFNCHVTTQSQSVTALSQNSEVRLRILHLCGNERDVKIGVWSPRPRPRSHPSPTSPKIGAAIPSMNC